MRRHQPSEDVATEPYAARGDDASGTFCLREKLFKRNFVLQKLVAVQTKKRKKCSATSPLVETGTGTLPPFRYQAKPHRTETR